MLPNSGAFFKSASVTPYLGKIPIKFSLVPFNTKAKTVTKLTKLEDLSTKVMLPTKFAFRFNKSCFIFSCAPNHIFLQLIMVITGLLANNTFAWALFKKLLIGTHTLKNQG